FLITARGKDDGIRGLEAGADDYLTKPLFGPELVPRLRALFRRHRFEGTDVLRVHNLELNRTTGTVARAGRKIELTHREFSLLEALMLASPEPMAKSVLLKRVWKARLPPDTNVVNVVVNHLRNKIRLPAEAPLLHTVRGVGFVLKMNNE